MNKQPKNKQPIKENDIPMHWRYIFIFIAILALLVIMFGKQGPQRTDFPSHVPKAR